ncbi:MAG: hypothetical protein IAF38_20460 [Bacteroidia bacterium]|nr:hypothetical protein [Bacteroidia bacterium]
MKKLISSLFVAGLVTLASSQLLAQTSVCGQFHRTRCAMDGSKDDDREFLYNAQSKSGLFAQGSTSKLRCVVYKGMDYRLTVCAETDILGDNIQFKIYDGKTQEQLFDNTKEEGAKQFEFSSSTTRQLIIEVFIPSGETKGAKGKPLDAACVGLLIEHKVSDRTGFSQY